MKVIHCPRCGRFGKVTPGRDGFDHVVLWSGIDASWRDLVFTADLEEPTFGCGHDRPGGKPKRARKEDSLCRLCTMHVEKEAQDDLRCGLLLSMAHNAMEPLMVRLKEWDDVGDGENLAVIVDLEELRTLREVYRMLEQVKL